MKLCILSVVLFLQFAAIAADDLPQPGKPQNGVFVQRNGYTFTVLELKDGHYHCNCSADINTKYLLSFHSTE